jgi:hypothetical protein
MKQRDRLVDSLLQFFVKAWMVPAGFQPLGLLQAIPHFANHQIHPITQPRYRNLFV